jgi:hypothetical protein
MKQKLMSEHMEYLKTAGLRTPNAEVAERWKAQLQQIEQVELISMKIRHFLVAPPFSSTRIFVVKTVIHNTEKQQQPRYFSLSARNRFFNFFWVNEHSKWIWLFSI